MNRNRKTVVTERFKRTEFWLTEKKSQAKRTENQYNSKSLNLKYENSNFGKNADYKKQNPDSENGKINSKLKMRIEILKVKFKIPILIF